QHRAGAARTEIGSHPMGTFNTDAAAVPYGRLIGLNVQKSNPPTEAYIGVDDALLVQAWNSQPSQSVHVSVRLPLPDGTIVPIQWSFTRSWSRSRNPCLGNLVEWFLLSCTAMANAVSAPGRASVSVSLSRGYPVSTVYGQILMQGYIGTPNALLF